MSLTKCNSHPETLVIVPLALQDALVVLQADLEGTTIHPTHTEAPIRVASEATTAQTLTAPPTTAPPAAPADSGLPTPTPPTTTMTTAAAGTRRMIPQPAS